jgi:hypothetical protein
MHSRPRAFTWVLPEKERVGSKMKRFKLIGVTLLAVFAMGAVMASAAQAEPEAPYWTVAGTRLEAGQTRFITAKEAAPFVLTGPKGTAVVVTCTETAVLPHAVLLGSEPKEPGTNDEIVSFKSCKVENNGTGSECGKVEEPINTVNLKSELVLDAKTHEKLLVLFQPASGTLLAELKFPTGCKLTSTKVSGSVLAEALNEKSEAITTSSSATQYKSGFLKFPAAQPADLWLIKGGVGKEVEVKTLEAFGGVATLEGTALILLAELNSKNELVSTGELWSALA